MNSKATPVTAPAILDAAAGHMRDRAATYDKPEGERSMAQTVDIFNLYHGTKLTEAQGWHFMQVLKDVRLFTRPGYHADSAEDGVAYAGLKCEAKAKEKVEPPKGQDFCGCNFFCSPGSVNPVLLCRGLPQGKAPNGK